MTEQPAALPKRRRWVGIVLLISLALNLLVAGFFISHKLKPERYKRISGPGYTQIIPRKFFYDVGRSRKDELVGAMRQHRRLFRDERRELRATAIKVADALNAEPFDRQALVDALAAYRAQAVHLIDKGGEIGIQFFDMLTPEERKLVSHRIRQKAEGRRKKRKKSKQN